MSRAAAAPLGKRQYALAAALAVTVAATMWAAQLEDEVTGQDLAPVSAAGKRGAATAAVAAAPAGWAPPPREAWPEAGPAQLAAWAPPPPPAPPPAPPQPLVVEVPPPPVAPPFPYQLIGRLEDEVGVSQALLAGPARSISARAGDVIDGQWRVERVGPTGLGLTWLPAQLPQNITFRPAP